MNVNHENSLSDDPLGVYAREASRVPEQTHEEELTCIRQVIAGGPAAAAAGKQLVEAKLRHVIPLARFGQTRFGNTTDEMILDAIQQANEGLILALEYLEDCRQESFWSFALPFVERAVSQGRAAG